MTLEFLFTPAERCHFADDYARLGLHPQVLRVQLTTQRLAGGLGSAVLVLVSALVKSLLPQA